MSLVKKGIKYIVTQLILIIKFITNQVIWIKRNKHNKTRMGNYFPLNVVSVGNWTYGKLIVHYFEGNNEELRIGNYVSIGPDVEFFLGGEHHPKYISNYPFALYIPGCNSKEKLDRSSKGPIIIDDDVWIGAHVLILSGVHIGQGAVIGAGSVVAKDIPPYAIFINNEIVKYRFDEETVEKLLNINYSRIDGEFIVNHLECFYTPHVNQVLDNNELEIKEDEISIS